MTNRIRETRKKQGMSIVLLAQKTQLTSGYIANLERGERKNPTWGVMEAIATALHKSIPEIFFPEEGGAVNGE